MSCPTENWLTTAPTRSRGMRRVLWALLLVYALCAWWGFGDGAIGASWRECDTQAIARSLALDFDLLRPRVDWRGATDGGVECEFPLYQGAIAVALRAFGDVEWPGRLLSLLAIVGLAATLFSLLERRAGALPAMLGTLAFLGGAQATFLATRVMPDATSTALAVGGLVAFAAYVQGGGSGWLAAAMVLSAVGVLAKPTAAHVLLLQGSWLLLLAPVRLRDARLWLGWAGVVAVTVAWLLHARAVGQSTGLTFGVTFGDTKMPALEHLLRPGLYRDTLQATASYGMSWIGFAAVALLIVRRRFDRVDAAWLLIVGIGLVGSLRYSHTPAMGPQYHVWSALAGAWFVARAWPPNWPKAAAVVAGFAFVAHGAWNFHHEHVGRVAMAASSHVQTAAVLRELSRPEDLVVVRGPKVGFDPFWRRPNNCEEPVLLYLGHRKGWILPSDGVDPSRLEAVAVAGARWYVDPAPESLAPETGEWLARNATLASSQPGARIFRLRSR